MAEVPYIDFYKKHGISPVGQDISDLNRHFQRRDSLYRFLGIPPAFLAGRTVAEFGPGSGHNALFTMSLRPDRYLLVDGNPKGVADTRANLARHFPDSGRFEVVESLFEEFDTTERFDLVLCEGFLPHLRDPAGMTRRLARFVRPGGILVITTVSPVSVVAENLRRLIRTSLIEPNAPASQQLELLRPVLGSHLATLKGMSRSVDDWLLDNIVQPVAHAGLLSIPDAVSALEEEFDLYGASPAFATDLRWYKDVHGDDRGFNRTALAAYYGMVANFLDYRVVLGAQPAEIGERIERLCRALWDAMNRCELQNRVARPAEAIVAAEELAATVLPLSPDTGIAIGEAATFLRGGRDYGAMRHFPFFWGRGQQYLSFIRR